MRLGLALVVLMAFQDQNPDAVCPMNKLEDGFYCKDDDALLQKSDLNDKGECPKCGKKPQAGRICVREYFACPGCTEKRLKQEDCCAGKMIKKISRCRVIFRCKGCGAKSDKQVACSSDKCECKGKQYAQSCEKSGTFPHGNRDQ